MDEMAAWAAERLRRAGDPERARQMAAYMKTEMPFYGVPKPKREPIFRELRRRFPIKTRGQYEDAVRELWAGSHREEKYLAVGVARSEKRFITLSSLPLYRRLVREGAWWDLVDEVAIKLIGRVLLLQRDVAQAQVERLVDDPNLWLRRTAMISQVDHKGETDEAFLFDACLRRSHESEFFIRKAIGWALRQHSKTNPDAVREFLAANHARLSPLSVREASKYV